MERDIIETRGVAALQRLFAVAHRDSGQCRYIARFLLGLYNGTRFPFDLTDLRAIDDALFDDCVAVLRMDARLTRQEVHKYFDNGQQDFEQLARDWGVEDMYKVREDAKRAAQPVGTPAPLHEGGSFDATLHTYGDAPGYRDVSVYARIGEQGNTEVRLRLTPGDSETLMLHVTRVHAFAWRDAERGPLDKKPGERRPAWLDKAPAQWGIY
ncbi:hypothetical protein J2W32_006458 [Variovorax boronicumulans]|uniref:Uncharacterized protein n=1 Tax=Variovorax boronicumulans TaxID=436515 RepID=A0AAW8D484_9BURK|nr:hypothetical protein [Variovorax boronicumulans]MDP9897385.1 hypothetical protein [Variovorax boronicumulans]MDQ0057381.1 hypothetical protein [Variovorax boronicumulans]